MPTATNDQAPEVRKIRMMVLETDEQDPEADAHAEKGEFGDVLHHHFAKSGLKHDPPLGVVTDQRFVVGDKGGQVPSFDEFADIDSVLMTGSTYDAHGNDGWILEMLELLRQLYLRRPDCKLSGVCFGHQLICRLFGSTVAPSPKGDWELGHSRIDLTPVGQRLFRSGDSQHIHLHQMHRDHVVEAPSADTSGGVLAPGTEVFVWGSSPHTRIQGIFIANRVFTTQAHLAFDANMVHRQIQMRVDSGGIKDLAHADRAKETAHLEHDGDVAAAAILRFFHNEDKHANKGVAFLK